MAYTFSVNNLPATGTAAIWLLITTLISAGWTQVGSGDGSTYANGSAGPVTGSGSGATGLGNSNAWVRIQAPSVNQGAVSNQTREWLFQRGTDSRSWRFKYSASAGFSGGSPSATVAPTGTDQVVMLGAGTDASPTYTASWLNTDGSFRWHIGAGGAAENYAFYAFSWTPGNISMLTSVGLFMDTMAAGSFPATDVDPAVTYVSNTSGSGTPFGEPAYFAIATNSALANITNPAKARAWLGATSQADIATSGTNNQGVQPAALAALGATNVMLGTNPFTGKDDLIPVWWLRPGASVPPTGLKGASTLLLHGSVFRNALDTIDFASTKDKIYVGNTCSVWFPWAGVSPLYS